MMKSKGFWGIWGSIVLFLATLGLTSCGHLGYYAQAVHGHFALLERRESIAELLQQARTPQTLKKRLRYVQQARRFASEMLALPDNGSYRTYADLQRPYVVWNVFAAPELALQPVQSCFLVAGCLSYRGYFAAADARAYAEELRRQGHDVYVGGVTAYSTLGWFDDPVLNTMLRHADFYLSSVIFHELAHQRLYIEDDSAFNEAFASAVEQAGMERWLAHYGDTELSAAYREWQARKAAFTELVLDAVERLQAVYAEDVPDARKRLRKDEEFAALRARYRKLKEKWDGYSGYDKWFARDLNNAKLLTVHTYQALVPGFLSLLEQHGGDFAAFYRAAESLAELPRVQRWSSLRKLNVPPCTSRFLPPIGRKSSLRTWVPAHPCSILPLPGRGCLPGVKRTPPRRSSY